jgi:pimeloyl-ACP methyl ester carboxylesterase
MKEIYLNNPDSKATLIFLHGWCLSPESFHEQINYFRRNYSILAPNYSELVGDMSISQDRLLSEIVERISIRIRQLNLSKVIFIGHSMGGIIALQLAARFIKVTFASIIIDTTMPSSIKQQKIFRDFLASLSADNQEEQIRGFISRRMHNPQLDDRDRVNLIIKEMVDKWGMFPERFNQLLYQAVLFDSEAALRILRIPLMYLGGIPPCGDIEKLQQIKSDIIIKSLPCGHFIMNNLPQDLNLTIEKFNLSLPEPFYTQIDLIS